MNHAIQTKCELEQRRNKRDIPKMNPRKFQATWHAMLNYKKIETWATTLQTSDSFNHITHRMVHLENRVADIFPIFHIPMNVSENIFYACILERKIDSDIIFSVDERFESQFCVQQNESIFVFLCWKMNSKDVCHSPFEQ